MPRGARRDHARASGGLVTSYGYDGSGNLRVEYALPSLAVTTYNNDPEDRMNIAQNPDNTRWTYTYSGDGLMRSFVGPGIPMTTLVWDGTDVIQERS